MKLLNLFLPLALTCYQAFRVNGEKAYIFQPNNELTNSSLASLTFDLDSEVMTNLSVCTWLRVNHFREKTYVFSYATSDRENNELNMGIRENAVFIALGGKYHFSWSNHSFVPDVWYHFCFVVDGMSWFVYIDGRLDRELSTKEQNIFLNGSLVLGQETDLLDGGFQEQQSFSGTITGFNLYGRALTSLEVETLEKCLEGVAEGNLVAWSSAVWSLQGPVEEIEVSQDEYCRRRTRVNVYPERRTRSGALDWCQILKAEMTLPKDAEENTRLYHISEPFVDVCQPPNHAKGFLWLGATDDANEGLWTDLRGRVLNYTNFKDTYKQQNLDCACMLVPPYREEWDDVKCSNIYHFCVACEEKEPVVLKMRGLCEEDKKAAWFVLRQRREDRVFMKGFTKYLIFLEEDAKTWHLYDSWLNRTIATQQSHDSAYPIGVREWKVDTGYRICSKPSGVPITLGLSACYDWEYSCKDGTCISLEQRCDLRVDCPDNSDEIGCDKLVLPVDYLQRLTPPGVTPGPLGVNLSLNLHSFSEINVRDMRLTIDFTLMLSWHDIRLQYRNLKDVEDINYVEPSSVWSPAVELTNAHFPDVHMTNRVLTVSKTSEPEEDDPSRVLHDKLYEGKNNPLQLRHKFNAPFSCNMDLRMFPFDTQHCKMLLSFTSSREDFLDWESLQVAYLGETFLTEYEVGDITIGRSTHRNYSVAEVSITLHRRFWCYITSAYLPTLMLIFICYASLFCKRENIDLRVMMALTTLLVLYALYQQISDGLPRTPYTKAIDAWCFFAITLMFTQVIYHILLDLDIRLCIRSCHDNDLGTKELLERKEIVQRVDRAFRLFFAVVKMIFFGIYWCVVLRNVEN